MDKEFEEILPTLVEKVLEKLSAKDIQVPVECHGFVERCLRLKDYSVERAVTLLEGFRGAVVSLSDLWEAYDPKVVKTLFTDGSLSLLRSRDEFGRQIFVARCGRWDPSQLTSDQVSTCCMFFLGWVVGQSVETQRKGVIFLVDLTNYGMKHLRAVNLSRFGAFVRLMQSGVPARIKAIHFVFHPRIIWYIYSVVKPFVKEKLKKRLYFHGDDVSSLHKHLKPEILTEALGGKLGEVEASDKETIMRFLGEDSLHTDLLKFGFAKN